MVNDALVEQLKKLSNSVPNRMGWSVRNLVTGWSAHHLGDTIFPAASTRKVAILMTVLKEVNEGRLRLDQPMRIDRHVIQDSGGCFQYLSPGITITLKDALVMMIIVSDNTCTSHVAALVGLERVNALCQALGMSGTTHRSGVPADDQPRNPDPSTTNSTTPNDQVLLLSRVINGMSDEAAASRLGCTPAQCRLAIDIMSWQKFRSRIPSWLPEGTVVASKTGTTAGVQNDVAVVFKDGQPLYSLAIFACGIPQAMPDGAPGGAVNDQVMGQISRKCWDAFTSPS